MFPGINQRSSNFATVNISWRFLLGMALHHIALKWQTVVGVPTKTEPLQDQTGDGCKFTSCIETVHVSSCSGLCVLSLFVLIACGRWGMLKLSLTLGPQLAAEPLRQPRTEWLGAFSDVKLRCSLSSLQTKLQQTTVLLLLLPFVSYQYPQICLFGCGGEEGTRRSVVSEMFSACKSFQGPREAHLHVNAYCS